MIQEPILSIHSPLIKKIDMSLIKYLAEFVPEVDGNTLELKQHIADNEITFFETPSEVYK